MSNTLRQVKHEDFLAFEGCLITFMKWYRRECDRIRAISEAWTESEDKTLVSILSGGLWDLEAQTEMMKEADRQ